MPNIRLRHIAMTALIVAVIATVTSFRLRFEDYTTSQWIQFISSTIMWGCFGLLIYTYVGYPVVLTLLSRLFGTPVGKKGMTPTVSVILAAYNEESVIADKIRNLLELDYPADRLEILIGSDGSTDRTVEIAEAHHDSRIRVFNFTERSGKINVINRLVPKAKGDILIFTDASEIFDLQAIRHLVANFSDPTVGAVSGQLMMTGQETNGASRSVSTYWSYEKKLRAMEGHLYSMLGATGAIYALRRSLFRAPAANTILDDVAIPMAVVRNGYRVVFEPEAVAYEKATDRASDEFKRKVRTLTGNYQEYFHLDRFLGYHSIRVAFQIFSHKILRLLAPMLMLGMFAASFIAPGANATLLLAGQIGFYSLAFLGLAFPLRTRLVSVPYMFTLMNLAAAYAAVNYFLRSSQIAAGKSVLWEKTKENLFGGSSSGSMSFDVQPSGDTLQVVGTLTGVRAQMGAYFKIKPVFDYAGAALGLVVTAPLMGAIALAVKLDSRGPVLYKQVRVGRNGQTFEIYKFRSMVVDAEKNTGAVWASKHDPRVTRIGHFLRNYHLDELPQLINVLKGDMSLIGPRPERPDFVHHLSQNIEGYTGRLAVKPGITGLAQVLHKYDETLQDVRQKVRYDLDYIRTAGFLTDLRITWLTIKRMFVGQE